MLTYPLAPITVHAGMYWRTLHKHCYLILLDYDGTVYVAPWGSRIRDLINDSKCNQWLFSFRRRFDSWNDLRKKNEFGCQLQLGLLYCLYNSREGAMGSRSFHLCWFSLPPTLTCSSFLYLSISSKASLQLRAKLLSAVSACVHFTIL